MPRWLIYSLLTILLWGAWGVQSKLMVDRTSAYTNQVVFTFGLALPAGLALVSKRRFQARNAARGLVYAAATGLLGGLGNVAFYMALESGQASVVAPLTALFPLVTVLLALVVLKERLNRGQLAGLALALAAIYLLST